MKMGKMNTGRMKMGMGLGILALVALVFAAGAGAEQKKDKKKKGEAPPMSNEYVSKLPEDQQVDFAISEMLAAWQVGDVELLRRHIADEVIVVSGAYEAPVVGWAKYLEQYQRGRAQAQQQQMDRKNTLIALRGTTAWATYQWTYTASRESVVSQYQGHTTLVLEKRNGRWVVLHNHTSLVYPPAQQQTAAVGKQ